MKKTARKIDALLKKDDLKDLVVRKLLSLKAKILKPRVVGRREFLSAGRKLLLRFGFLLPRGSFRSAAVLAFLSLLLMTAMSGLRLVNSGERLGKQILGTTTSALEQLQSGSEVDSALESFERAADEIRDSNEVLRNVLQVLPARYNPETILAASAKALSAWQLLDRGMEILRSNKLIWDTGSNSSGQQFFLKHKEGRGYFSSAARDLEAAAQALREFDAAILPEALQTKFLEAQGRLAAAAEVLDNSVAAQGALLNLLGGEPKTYVLIFQNNAEARASGGFIGTYGLLEFGNGQMKITKIESVYALDGQLREKIAAPGPLQRQVSSYWGMRDANWFVDFPATSRKILEFLEKGGILADGVIAFTPNVFENFLKLTGPVEMPEYGLNLTAENFRETVQYKTSLDYDYELNEPKKFLADFAPRFLTKLQALEEGQWLDFLNEIFEMISQKHLLLFSLDPEFQQVIASYRADGGISATPGDYLAIFHSNVGGGKTDQNIRQKVEKQVSLDRAGLVIVKLRITRIHEGYEEKFFPKNLDYMRILVPNGAKLLSASGFDDYELLKSSAEGAMTDPDLALWDREIMRDEKNGMYVGREGGYTVFANWLTLLPGESKSVELVYEVDFGSRTSYSHLLQTQPGAQPFEFALELNYLPGQIVYYYPPNFVKQGNQLVISQMVNNDQFYGIVGQ